MTCWEKEFFFKVLNNKSIQLSIFLKFKNRCGNHELRKKVILQMQSELSILNKSEVLSEVGTVIENIKYLLSLSGSGTGTYHWISHKKNQLAHTLARFAFSSDHEFLA